MSGNFKKVCWTDTVLEETQTLLPIQYPINDLWEHSQDALESQNLSQNDSQIQNFLETNSKVELSSFDKDNVDNSSQEGEQRKVVENILDSKNPIESSIIDTVEKNQNTVHQKVPSSGSQIENSPEFPKKRELEDLDSNDQIENAATKDRPLKKVKSGSGSKSHIENEENSSKEFYPDIDHFLEKHAKLVDVGVLKNASSASDESLTKDRSSHQRISDKGNLKYTFLHYKSFNSR